MGDFSQVIESLSKGADDAALAASATDILRHIDMLLGVYFVMHPQIGRTDMLSGITWALWLFLARNTKNDDEFHEILKKLVEFPTPRRDEVLGWVQW